LFKFLQQEAYPPYYELPLADRFRIIKNSGKVGWHNAAALVRMALSQGSLDKEIASFADNEGWTLLHYCALSLAANQWCSGFWEPEKVYDTGIKATSLNHPDYPCRKLLRDVVAAGAQLHAVDSLKLSPLYVLITSAYRTSCLSKCSISGSRT
jgi:hypothetical protein